MVCLRARARRPWAGAAGGPSRNRAAPIRAGSLILAANIGDSGAYILSEGLLSAGNETVGWAGTGTFTQSGGTNISQDGLAIGSGTYNLSGTALLSIMGVESVNGGTFTQTGGTNFAQGGLNFTYSGNYNLRDGLLSASGESLGYWGRSTFVQSGGTNNITLNSCLTIGGINCSPTYTLSDSGLLSCTGTEYVGTYVLVYPWFPAGTGTFTQSGGTNAAGTLCLANDPDRPASTISMAAC